MTTEIKNKDPFGSIIRDIPRTHVRTTCWVYSHVNDIPHPVYPGESAGKINCTRDLLSCDTNKNIKGGGSANLTLAPSRNYVNIIYPNDYIVIYFDMGDGRGSILTFFGFVDRITRNISTDASTGATTTLYTLDCTDFTKAFIMTNIYFNQRLMGREDMTSDASITSNLGGVQFYLQGVTLSGNPAEFVLSLLIALFGFNSQCRLPKSFPINGTYANKNRSFVKNYARKLLHPEVRNLARGPATIRAFEKAIEKEARVLQEAAWKDPKSGFKKNEKIKPSAINSEFIKRALKARKLPANTISSQAWKSYKTIVDVMVAGNEAKYLLDLMDLTLVEDELMDGRLIGQMISWEQGSLWELMNSFSNDFVNELFCDLRPVAKKQPHTGNNKNSFENTKDKERGQQGVSAYVVEPDDIESNTPGDGNTGAVRFQPSLIMREYPFSTIEGIVPPENFRILNKQVGLIQFGAIFSSRPNQPGRHVLRVKSRSLRVLDRVKKGKLGIGDIPLVDKTLDVSVISVQDIIQESIGRSDADHVNLIEVYSDITAGHVAQSGSKFLSRVLNPLLTPTHIMKHGLRPRKYETPFGKFSEAIDVYGGTVDPISNQQMNFRWVLLLDHWYQHNIEYFNGTISTRGFPEIRVGYRLDILERHESYYIEGVSHSWTFGQPLTTTFTVTRGQRNDPFPVYVLPPTESFKGARLIGKSSRLDQFFKQMDVQANDSYSMIAGQIVENRNKNEIDDISQNNSKWALDRRGYISADSTELSVALERFDKSRITNRTKTTISDEFENRFKKGLQKKP